MNIVHVIDYFQPKIGYQETFLARYQKKLGHTVTVLTSDRYFPFPRYEDTYSTVLGNRIVGPRQTTEEGIAVTRLPTWELPGSPLVYLRSLSTTLQKLKPDLVLCHGVYSLTSARLAWGKRSYRLIYDTHAAAFNTDFQASVGRRAYHALYHQWAVPQIKATADRFFAIGEEEQAFLCRDFGLAHHVVPIIRLGVETNLFVANAEKKSRQRQRWQAEENDLVLLHAGKLLPTKEIHVLLEAVKKTGISHLVVVLIGKATSSDYEEKLLSLSTHIRVVRIPFSAHSDLPDYFAAADVAVWPGDPSITMLEVMSCAVPLLTAMRRGTDYLRPERGVERFPQGNSDALSEKITDLYYNKQKRIRLAAAARRYCETNLSWDVIAQQVIDL